MSVPLLRPVVIRYLVLAAIVIPLALAARWHWFAGFMGQEFMPRPDALEYAAGAQSIADVGEYYLQIGPHRAHPRYPPGWSALLSIPLRLGLPADQLWRFSACFGAVLAWLLGAICMALVTLYPGRSRSLGRPGEVAGLAAGLLVGGIWAVAPLPTFVGQTLLSDEPAALFGIASFVCLVLGIECVGAKSARRWMLVGGWLFGITLSMRTINAALMLPGLGLLLLVAAGSGDRRDWLHRCLWCAAGVAVPVVATSWLLSQSGYPFYAWSGYAFWVPDSYASLSDTFKVQYALSGNPEFLGGLHTPHLKIGLYALLGLPGMTDTAYVLRLWPIVGWLVAGVGLAAVGARRWPLPRPVFWVGLAVGIWCLFHWVVYSLYFFPGHRFYLVPLALNLVGLGTALGLSLRSESRELQALASLGLIAILFGFQSDVRRVGRAAGDPEASTIADETKRVFESWRNLPDDERAGGRIPFQSVVAQALGLLTRQAVDAIDGWGKLKKSEHVLRLRKHGYLSGFGPKQKPKAQSPFFELGNQGRLRQEETTAPGSPP